MRQNIIQLTRFLSVSLFSLLLLSCGGGGSGGSPGSKDTENTQQGVFLDAVVEGISYTSGSISGTTDANGTFNYQPGQSITFKIGDIVIGTATGAPIITPTSFVSDTDPNGYHIVINTIRFLMTLDSDGDPDNGIQISEAVRSAAVGQKVDFSVSAAVFDSDSKLINALSVMIAGSRPLVDEKVASEHFRKTFNEIKSNIAGDYSGTFSGDNNGTWSITVDKDGNISGSGHSNDTGLDFTVSGNVKSNGMGGFGYGGTANFKGYFSLNGCFVGTWEEDVYPPSSGTFTGSKTGASASNCSAMTPPAPDSGSKGGGNTGGGTGTSSGSVSITGTAASVFGGNFSPRYVVPSTLVIQLSDVDITVPSSIANAEIMMLGYSINQQFIGVSLIKGGNTFSCGIDNACTGISTGTNSISFSNTTLTAESGNTVGGSITLNGSLSYTP